VLATGGSDTNRESEILALITRGKSNDDVAALRFVSKNSIKSYIRSAGGALTTASSVGPRAAGPSPDGPDAPQVMVTPTNHTAAANSAEVSSIRVETPTARKAALVDGHAVRVPTRCTSDA
jgi:Bacterial regulatory proteins, luxR family